MNAYAGPYFVASDSSGRDLHGFCYAAAARVRAAAMDLRHLHTLVVLAEELHYGRAARRLHVVQSAVSRTVQDLEQEVGALLFRRTQRRVELTAAGAALVRRSREILADAARAAAECRAVSEGKLGRLRVAICGVSGLGYLPEALRAFAAMNPAVEIELSRRGSAELAAALAEGRLDVAFSHTPLDDDAVVIEPILSERLCAILPTDHPRARARAASAAELLRDVVAILPRVSAPEIHRALMAHARAHGVPAPRVVEVEDVNLMMTLVAAGLAVSHLPEGEARLGYRGVVAVPVEPVYEITLHAMYRKDHGSPLIALLLAEMRRGR